MDKCEINVILNGCFVTYLLALLLNFDVATINNNINCKTMKTIKKIGIWMDHSNAHLIEFSSEIKETKTITSDFTFQDREETLQRSESEMHNKEQHKQTTFYKNLAAVIENFDEVLLFGPTDAKVELYNFIKEHHKYDKIKIEVKNADKMTDTEQHHFVKDYFKRFEFKM